MSPDKFQVSELRYDRVPWQCVTLILRSHGPVDLDVAKALLGELVTVEGDEYGVTITRIEDQ